MLILFKTKQPNHFFITLTLHREGTFMLLYAVRVESVLLMNSIGAPMGPVY